ncbi:NADH dehydrogenase [ubiquinone] iron-sulfur protein 6, mitochondrial [Capsicum baccatum]|uniref:NADH dehydrogenase [ubiquinone] iron-sulfur protein 6, mitochondrial n=1 Tax=Capsicum baccatum TaxID=33114 RepID=A0A2G2X7H7_CAPBA|nr:NADH dehydrogenase [ubiquinone] iron-sulfur protein 6, mitochondrial [Capsicum baccatum]PHU23366.1 NADH dehydrogenase [ubiquinone] iron-sulfur protein 6, mitochondrial [Capsicum chinense]
MASLGTKQGISMATNLLKTLTASSSISRFNTGCFTSGGGVVSSEVITSHTDKWMQDTSKKSPMELINEVPPIKVEGRIAACEGDTNPALGHPIEYICLDLPEPAICKYCGLRFVQDHHH